MAPEPPERLPRGHDRREARALREAIRERASGLGFARVGFARADVPLDHDQVLQHWIDEGMHAGMDFVRRTRALRHDPRSLLPEARTAVVAVARYSAGEPDPVVPIDRARIARYARGADYHVVVAARLRQLWQVIERDLVGGPVAARVAVDSAPLLERELAMAAGVGFIGKNTMLISPGLGSFTVLGELLLGLYLPPDRPARPRCGSCRRCLDACPTGAIVEPFVVDARRCLSYLTIEHRGEIPEDLRGRFSDSVFGCDLCQQVCPFNVPTRRSLALATDARLGVDPYRRQDAALIDLSALLALRAGAHRRLVRGRALARAPAAAWRRNAVLVAAARLRQPEAVNADSSTLLDALRRAADDRDPHLRELARQALSEIDEPDFDA